jgi:hypothetical protein
MTKLLRDLLAAQEPLFTQSLRELEYITGKKNIDSKLSADILEKISGVTRSLGLDVADTTDRELFHALSDRVREHNENLAESLGSHNDAPIRQIVPKLVRGSAVNKSTPYLLGAQKVGCKRITP